MIPYGMAVPVAARLIANCYILCMYLLTYKRSRHVMQVNEQQDAT